MKAPGRFLAPASHSGEKRQVITVFVNDGVDDKPVTDQPPFRSLSLPHWEQMHCSGVQGIIFSTRGKCGGNACRPGCLAG